MTRSCKMALYFVTGLIIGFGGTFCRAQGCADDFHYTSLHCFGPNGCHSAVTYGIAIPGAEVSVGVRSLSCCGQLFSDEFDAGPCEGVRVLLAQPGVMEQITRLTAISHVVVADCRGRYVPYHGASLSAPREVGSPLDDHALVLR